MELLCRVDKSKRPMMKPIAITSRMKKRDALAKPQSSGVRIVLIDDNELLRAGVKLLISAKDDFSIVGEARDKAHAIDLVKRDRPDVILLDIELHFEDGLEMIPDLLAASETSRLAVLTSSSDPEVHRQAMLRGAIGVISKEESPELLLNAITRVHSGGVWLDHFVTAKMLGDLSLRDRRQSAGPQAKKIATLTRRECEVIQLVGEGLKNKEIAERLFISEVTVHHHLTSIYSKLEVKDRFELMVYAYRNRLADVPR
jgi:two-component system, NarL family, nitrate/nitrite response regulator NarL